MAPKNTRKYNDDFKKMVVGFYHYQTGSSVSKLSREFGISEVNWIKLHSPIESAEELTAAEVVAI
ncbi:hypothetical protein [Bacillus sp. 37MA]|uniref:hypothetical protein n=1 Tax=Bacillus sp. 37MA TaxID=1132442 RepID=UPI000382820C|nr:hypothetical protein [Bacillus sp. 37MA]